MSSKPTTSDRAAAAPAPGRAARLNGGRKTEDGRQTTEDGRQRTEDRRQAAEGRTQQDPQAFDAGGSIRAEPPSAISSLSSAVSPPSSAIRPPSSSLVREAGRDPETVAFERQVVDFFIEASDILGAPKSVAAIYGMIFASPEPIGFLELQERLDISAGSISQGVKALKGFGAILVATDSDFKSTGLPSQLTSRRDLYVPNLQARKLVGSWLNQRLQKHLDLGERRLNIIADAVSRTSLGRSQLAERMGQLRKWHQKAASMMPMARLFLST